MKATLGNVPLLANRPISWKITSGTEPVFAEFDVDPRQIPILLGQAGFNGEGVQLIINDGLKDNIFNGLFILRELPSDNPNIGRVEVTDRRWIWKTKIIKKGYNLRRRVGSRRRVGGKQDDNAWRGPLQDARTDDIFLYRFASLDDGVAWNARRALEDILTNDEALAERKVQIESDVDRLRNLPVENLIVDEPGDKALARVLTYIPGADVTIDPSGQVRIFSRLTGKEKGIVSSAGAEVVGGGHVEFINNKFTRPKEVHVYFTIECELRFDFLGDDVSTTTINDPTRLAENVLPVPDFKDLTLSDGRRVSQGTWITVKESLDAWKGLEGNTITFQDLNQAFIPEMKLWGPIGLIGKFDPDRGDANWSARISTIMQHYRQTFRIESLWVDRIQQFKPYLVGTVDLISRQRAPALAFADHAIKPSDKGFRRVARVQSETFYAWNVKGYPGQNVEFNETVNLTPARVVVVDSDQGIIRLEFLKDPFELSDMVFPAQLTLSGSPDVAIGGANNNKRRSNVGIPVAFNVRARGGNVCQLSTEQRAGILITAIPAAPNSKKQLYRVVVKPDEIAAGNFLPKEMSKELTTNESRGPIREIRVGPGVETARIRWKNDARETIQKIFGIGGQIEDSQKELADLITNDKVIGDNAASLSSIARAIAASVYAEEHDRVQGVKTARMNRDLNPEGWISEVTHEKNPDGRTFSIIGLPPTIPELSFFSFLDSSSRQILLRNIQPFD